MAIESGPCGVLCGVITLDQIREWRGLWRAARAAALPLGEKPLLLYSALCVCHVIAQLRGRQRASPPPPSTSCGLTPARRRRAWRGGCGGNGAG